MDTGFIDNERIFSYLRSARPPDARETADILAKARQLKGLDPAEAARLLLLEDTDGLQELFAASLYAKSEIYGKRLVLFAPLYVSNLCNNECLYCAFRKSNDRITRRTLSQDEIRRETELLVDQGHKRLLLVSGEGLGEAALAYSLKAIETIYGVKRGNGEIRRININIAALPVDAYRQLKQARVGTYQLFQETYHYDTFRRMHPQGPKADYLYHLTAMDRAMQGGIDDVGVGILFGLYDYRFEVLAMLQHIRHLEETFGVGCHTISLPRIEPATGSDLSLHPPYAVADGDFRKIIAVLRLTVPYTGMILSTRENAAMRREAFSLGISQISAGSRTNPGGYSSGDSGEQFSLGDHRNLEEVIRDIVGHGYIPSFCTGCYRLGRSGADFMDLAKPGLIKRYCLPNAMTSFKEYLVHYAAKETRAAGEELISAMLADIPDEKTRETTVANLGKIEAGSQDLYL
ncbi:MAG: [FeFe] hydrogenase H-cluster radical SAM maturase HydG [Acidobacteria bacterium]|jgi:2-iminoacetate synthase|nr:[FeFe] hydrogenase H-cluster radical SAM maturase HydG [Acidobacteriota bacterium]